MAIGAGPLYVNAVMGQSPSGPQQEHVRKTSPQITARHDIDIEESEQQPSRPDSWSMHYDRTDQAPYDTGVQDEMMTQASLLTLPKENPSRDLAFFLRTTGPTAPHRRPSKIDPHSRRTATPNNAFRFLKLGQKRSQTPVFSPYDEYTLHTVPPRQNDPNGPSTKLFLHDEGGLLFGGKKQVKKEEIQRVVSPFVQEVSSAGGHATRSLSRSRAHHAAGQKYLAIVPKEDEGAQSYGSLPSTVQPLRDVRYCMLDPILKYL